MKRLLSLLSLIALSSLAGTSRYVDAPELQTKDRAAINVNFQDLDTKLDRLSSSVDKKSRNLSIYSVMDYGAKPNDNADDAVAIQAALDAVPDSGGIVYFPPGTYNTSSTLNVNKVCTHIIGQGRRQRIATNSPSKIVYSGTGNVINVLANQGFLLENLSFDYPAAAGTVINAYNVASGYIRGCHFVGTSANGKAIDINDGSGWTFRDIDIEYFNVGIDLQQNNGDTLLDNVAVSYCSTGTRVGNLASSVGLEFIGLDYEMNTYGIELYNAHSVHISNSYFEQEGAGSYILRVMGDSTHNPQNITLKNSYMNGTTGSQYAVYLDRTDGFEASNILAINYASGFILNNHTNVSNVSMSQLSLTVPAINDYTGVIGLNTGGRQGIGPVTPTSLLHLKTIGAYLPRLTFEHSGRSWLMGADTSPDEFFLLDVTGSKYGLRIDGSTGYATMPGVYAQTSASAANVFVDSNGKLYRSTSALKFKKDIKPLPLSEAYKILDLRPITYKSKTQKSTDKRTYYGLIAEEAEKIDPRLVNHDMNGKPDGIEYDRLAIGLISIIKDLKSRIEVLEKK